MQPMTPAVVNKTIGGKRIVGSVRSDNGMLGVVLEDSTVLIVSGSVYLAHENEAASIIAHAEKRLVDEMAEVDTLTSLAGGTRHVESEADARAEATRMLERIVLTGPKRKRLGVTIGDIDDGVPDFLKGDVVGLGTTDVENRARLEHLSREIPDV